MMYETENEASDSDIEYVSRPRASTNDSNNGLITARNKDNLSKLLLKRNTVQKYKFNENDTSDTDSENIPREFNDSTNNFKLKRNKDSLSKLLLKRNTAKIELFTENETSDTDSESPRSSDGIHDSTTNLIGSRKKENLSKLLLKNNAAKNQLFTENYKTSEMSDSDSEYIPRSRLGTNDSTSNLISNRNKEITSKLVLRRNSIKNQRFPEVKYSMSFNENPKTKRKRSCCCTPEAKCVWGTILIAVSIFGFVYTPLELFLTERLNMRPGLPPFDWWESPPDLVRLLLHVFNVTNHERFMQGLDAKLNVEEVGPIVYLEKIHHYNIIFNDNGTMTYTTKREIVFLPEENSIDLNTTLILPNLAVLGISSYLYNTNYFIRSAFQSLVKLHKRDNVMFVNKTIYEFLWDYQDPLLDIAATYVPGLVPVNNMGMLTRMYSDLTDEMTVSIGQRSGHSKFFKIDKFRGKSHIPGYDAERCPNSISGSTEGDTYHQHLSKTDVLFAYRKIVCKAIPMHFESEEVVDNVPAYRYKISESMHDRVLNGTDCYDAYPSLPNGLSDGSKCWFDFPVAISFPHFYNGAPNPDVTGLQPDRSKHSSFVVVEPNSGIPFRSVVRMQSNLRMHDLSGYSSEYHKFSNLVIPMFWAEYNQNGLPSYIRLAVYFIVVVLPPLSAVILTCMFLVGAFFLAQQIYLNKLRNISLNSILRFKSKNVNNLAKNKMFASENKAFLRISSKHFQFDK